MRKRRAFSGCSITKLNEGMKAQHVRFCNALNGHYKCYFRWPVNQNTVCLLRFRMPRISRKNQFHAGKF
jgi:hypothetical protein